MRLTERPGDVTAALRTALEAVETALSKELDRRRSEVVAIDPRLGADVDRLISHLAAGGKRLRPQFLCAGWLATASTTPADANTGEQTSVPAAVVRAAAALELIQACALIHDDVIDRSDTRRGQPSVHRSVRKQHADRGWAGDAEHYGVSTALLIGDLALAWADDLFTEALVGLGRNGTGASGGSDEALAAWRAMRTEVLAGQLLDLRITADESPDPERAAADAMVVNRYKTAAYTVERPLHLGAALAGAEPGTVTALRNFGLAIGVAFQLRDDLLGVFGDPTVTGKPAGDDLLEGKKTVLLARARAALQAEPERRRELESGLGTALLPAEVERLTRLIADTGAPAAIEARIAELFEQGVAALDAQDGTGRPLVYPAAAQTLRSLAAAATIRER